MKKLFISQPMRDKSDEDILATRKKAIEDAKHKIGMDLMEVDSFFENVPPDATPLWYLGESIKLIETADFAYFCKDWEYYRGCTIEHECAVRYGIPCIYE